ncbi:MAG: antibiotic biosynthesis monooxygenase [Sulfitobacter sp.]|nr:antibiotic biosynthesis monooxygenase [Sulfitobacter sp.]
MSQEVTLTGRLICATEAQAERVRTFLPAHISATRAEPGCLFFEVTPGADPLIWELNERFESPDAFRAHQTRTAESPWAQETAGIERDYTLKGME